MALPFRETTMAGAPVKPIPSEGHRSCHGSSNLMTSDIRTLAREQFGVDSLRSGQEEMIEALLSGSDVLGILPTGGGKSLVYQLASQLLPGVTLVVSPLLALMKDQKESVEESGIDAESISSAETKRQEDESLERLRRGET